MWCIKAKRCWEGGSEGIAECAIEQGYGIEVEHEADGNTEVVDEKGFGD